MSSADPGSFQRYGLHGRTFYVKRDDLLDPLLSGNKYWKLYTLLHTPSESYQRIVSYGGSQSNAMLAIAALCAKKGWQFHYYCKPLAAYLKEEPSGNLKLALALDMHLHTLEHAQYATGIAALEADKDQGCLLIRQGAADPLAAAGMQALAKNIKVWQEQQSIERLRVVTPSGTGTTAYYLACAMPDVQVVTTAVVGDAHYLRAQMQQLGALPDNITMLEADKKRHFAKPYRELLTMYHQLREAGIEFDLIYGASMWYALLQHLHVMGDDTLLYLHSGGLSGNPTMLERYQRKGW